MALVIFESQVNMLTVATPSIGGFVVAYDLDGKLKQKDSNGIITLVGENGYASPLVDTLALGNNSGTYSIVMGNNTAITSAVGTASIKLDNNFIRLSTDGDSYQESYVTISPTQVNLTAKGGSSSILLSDSVEIAYKNTDKIYLTNDLFYVTLNGDKVVNFTTSTASQPAGSKISGVISSEQSYFSTLVTNSLILGGNNIVGTQSNSVYVPNILSQGPIKGIDGTAQLDFTQYNEAFLTSGDYMIGLVSSSASLAPNKNGIIMVDTLNSFSTTGIVNTGITYISSVNSSNNSGIVNSVVIGGFGLSATESNTVYLGNNVNINNAYKLPTTDGSANQVIITDGMGNLSWGSSVSNQVITITAASFSSLSSYMANTTYRITDADSSLYGGTEIYLSTNASGVLNDKGVGKFYNPKYNQAITDYGIWSPSGTYATSSTAIWGGYLWVNNNGTNINAAIDQFTLNPTEWNVIPFNGFNYNISYDEIKYDVTNNRITYRNERNTNIVNTSYDKIQTASFSAIKSFQWGNLYNTSTQKGIGSVKVDGTFINLINATGSNFTSKNYFGDTVYIGTASVSATTDRFVVSTTVGTASFIVNNNGSSYNISKGSSNTLYGVDALLSNTTGLFNSAFGNSSLRRNTTGSNNTAFGNFTLAFNTTGSNNTAFGYNSSAFNSSGTANSSFGFGSLQNNLASNNTAFGYATLQNNTTGDSNVAIGSSPLYLNTTGSNNIALGLQSLYNNTTGSNNIALGLQSLYNNTTGVILDEISFSPGAGYVDGEYSNVTLVYATGSSFITAPIVDIEIVGGEVVSVSTISYGEGFIDGTTILTINSYGTYSVGSGFEIGISGFVSGSSNTAIGYLSLYSNTTGSNNVAIGYNSLINNNTGSDNIALGRNSLQSNANGSENIALGRNSLQSNANGSENIALGAQSLYSNITGFYNTALGLQSLYSNTTGFYNTALGVQSLYSNINGIGNVALGPASLFSNTTGNRNIAIGSSPLYLNTTGSNNIALGLQSLYLNTTGYENTSLGFNSLFSNTTGWGNIALGIGSLSSNTTGDRNTALGWGAMRYYRGIWSVGLGGAALGAASTGIKTLSATFSPGTGYTPGTYSNVRLYWTSGTFWAAPSNSTNDYPTAEIVVGVGGTVSSVTLKNRGVLIPDTTTRFTVQTGTQSYQLGTASGTGFEIGIGTIGTASTNTALGYGTMYRLGVGSDNIAIGMWAGSSYGIPGSNVDGRALTGSDQSIFIGRFASALNNDSVNEIVIGNEAVGNGNNTVTLGNDSITKTILKGNVGIGATVTPATVNIKGTLNYQVNTATSSFTANGEIVYYGNGVGMTAGYLYALERDTGNWVGAENKNYYDCHLAIALGSTTEFGMLTKGYVSSNLPWYTMKTGRAQYLGNTASQFQEDAPNSGTLRVRIIGYPVGNGATTNMLYFNPDNMWLAQSVYNTV